MIMKCSLTLFKNKYDNKTHRRMNFDSFDDVEKLLYKLSENPGIKPKKDEYIKESSPLISPAIFKEGTTRKNVNVVEWSGFACMDIDSFEGLFEDAVNKFKDYRFVCYSTASSTEEHPRFRIILPLTASVLADKISHFWFALNNKFEMIGDRQTKDSSRMFYIPGKFPGAYNFIFSHKEAPELDPYELMAQYPYSEGNKQSKFSDAIQEMMLRHKKQNLTNTGFKWSSYKDCPFINKKMIAEYQTINGAGWYGQIFRILCSIAGCAIKKGYAITANEIAILVKELDADTGNWYKNRPLELEAERALNFVLKSF